MRERSNAGIEYGHQTMSVIAKATREQKEVVAVRILCRGAHELDWSYNVLLHIL